jgi:nitroreductase
MEDIFMFLSLVQKRRSIRKFLKKPVEEKKINMLIEAALRSPSSMGSRPCELLIVTERGLLEKLSTAKQHGSAFLKNAPLGIVVCADPNKSDVWVEDASIVSIFIQLTAESIGLGSCWIQIRERMHDKGQTAQEYIANLLNIPEKIKVESIIALGYPDDQKPPHKKETLQYEKVYFDSYERSAPNPDTV